MLTGTDLLKTVKNNHSSKSQLVKLCGYTQTNPDGSTKILFSKFYLALLEAKGITLLQKSAKSLAKALSYQISLHKNGNLIIGHPYTSQLNPQPGDKFHIKVSRNSITLTKT